MSVTTKRILYERLAGLLQLVSGRWNYLGGSYGVLYWVEVGGRPTRDVFRVIS